MKRAPIIFLVLASLLQGGCALTCYRTADVSFWRFTIGTDQQVGPIDMKSPGNQLKVGGIGSKQSEAAGEISGSITEAIIKTHNPSSILNP